MRLIPEPGEWGRAQIHGQILSSKEAATFPRSFKAPAEDRAAVCPSSCPRLLDILHPTGFILLVSLLLQARCIQDSTSLS